MKALAKAAFLAGLVAAPMPMANAQDADGAVQETAKEEVICKREPPPPGSRISGKRVCLTAEQWAARETQHGDELREAQQRSAVAMPPQ